MSKIDWGHLLFGFRGRINRAKWWLTVLVSIIIGVIAAIIAAIVHSEAVGNGVSFVASIVQLWISLAAGVKRLHDLNRTGAWLVLFYLGPVVLIGVFVGVIGMDVMAALLTDQTLDAASLARIGTTGLIVGVLALILAVWAFIWFGCLRGSVGPNQYGPDPLEGRM
jgi:uncharacterized membrane protein YhaH (DUF805 family)